MIDFAPPQPMVGTVDVADDGSTLRITSISAPTILGALSDAVLCGASDAGPIVDAPCTQANCEVLAEMGLPHIPKMVYDYDWPASFLPLPHQFRVGGALSTHKRFFCLADAGTGKTISVVWAVDYLMAIQRIKRVLVIAPLSLLEDTWEAEFKNGAPGRTTVVVHGSKSKRKQMLSAPHDVAIINYDGVEIVHEELLGQYDLVVLDESTNVKNINRRWKFVNSVTRDAEWVWFLTATPNANSPMDAYGQLKMRWGRRFPYTQTSWRTATMVQRTLHRWEANPDAGQIIRQWMQPAVYVNKRDVLKDLPPVTVQRRRVGLSAEQSRLMDDLKRQAMTVTSGGGSVSAVHTAALRMKIIQVVSGAVYDVAHVAHDVDNSPRLAELTELVTATLAQQVRGESPNNKVLVFCPFKHTVARVVQHLASVGVNVTCVTGETPARVRGDIFKEFQTAWGLDVIVAIPHTMAHGLNLTAATATIWFAPCDSSERFIQACNRTDRPGQRYPMSIWKLYGCDVERRIYDALEDSASKQRSVLAEYKELVSYM